jgi:hypothetical protein
MSYRLQQARVLLNNIQLTVISDGEPRKISVFEVTSVKEGYKSIDTFTPDDVTFVKNNILRDMRSLRIKLSVYREFKVAESLVQQAIDAMN